MNIDKKYQEGSADSSLPRYISPIKPMTTTLVMVIIAGAVLLVIMMAVQFCRGGM
jgi:hypothetical protein